MDSNDVKDLFSTWSTISMPDDAKQRVHEHLEQLLDNVKNHDRKPFREGFRTPANVITVVAAIAVIFFGMAIKLKFPPHVSTPVAISQGPLDATMSQGTYTRFAPPQGLVQAYWESSANGSLIIAGYCPSSMLNTQATTDYFRMASQAYIVVKNRAGERVVVKKLMAPNQQLVSIHKPLWFSSDNTWYAVTTNEGFGNRRISIYQFTSSSSPLGWNIKVVLDKTLSGSFQLPYRIGNHLLIRTADISTINPLYYSFAKSNLQVQTISDKWPGSGRIANSVTVTLHETVTRKNGTNVVTINGDPSPLHLMVGQTLVLRMTGNTSIPILALFHPDIGDPGDGSLATRLASPYTNAMLFRIVAPAQHGLVTFGFDMESNSTLYGIKQIPIVVQSATK